MLFVCAKLNKNVENRFFKNLHFFEKVKPLNQTERCGLAIMNPKTQEDDYIEIDLLRLGAALWHRAWAILLAALLLGAAGFSYAYYLVTPMYESTALMYVNNSDISVGSTSISLSDLSASKTLVDTYIVIMKTRTMLNEVIEEAELSYTYEELYEMIDAKSLNDTEIFGITVTGANPEEIERIANTVADILPGKISEIMDGSSARLVDFAVIPTKPSSPNIMKYTAMGVLAGLVLSCGIIILRVLLDEQIRGGDYLTQTYELPLLAEIPDLLSKKKGGYYSYGAYSAAGKERG